MFLTFYQLNNKRYAGQCTEISVPLTTKWMGISREEYPYWACQSAITYGNVLVKSYLPICRGYGRHVVILCLYHLVNLPRLINIGWGVSVSEPKFTSDGVKASFINDCFPDAIGVWICLLIKGGGTTKTLPLPSRAGGH